MCDTCALSNFDIHFKFINNIRACIDFCIDFCIDHQLILKDFKCPKCKQPCTISLTNHKFICNRRYRDKKAGKLVRCGFKQTIFRDTFFSGSHLLLPTILKFCKFFCYKQFNYEEVTSELHISSHTFTDWFNFCREVCVALTYGPESSEKIGGIGVTVEVDEAKFGKRKYNVGRVIEGQ
jgi:hypothetical protein